MAAFSLHGFFLSGTPRRGDDAICFVLMGAGLRQSEAAVLTWGDIEASMSFWLAKYIVPDRWT